MPFLVEEASTQQGQTPHPDGDKTIFGRIDAGALLNGQQAAGASSQVDANRWSPSRLTDPST
jgi:hypothetical protein